MISNRSRTTIRWITGIALITIVTLFFVWTRLQNIRLRLDSARLKEREREVLLENNRLKLEWARLISPRRLEELGRERFKLRRPAPDQIFVMRETGGKP